MDAGQTPDVKRISLLSDYCRTGFIPKSIASTIQSFYQPDNVSTMPQTSLPLTESLLGFAKLSAVDQEVFLNQLNQFIFASPHQRRAIVVGWERIGDASTKSDGQPIGKYE